MEVRDAGAQAGHDQTNEAGSQAADTTSDGTPTEPPRRSCPVPQRAHPKYATPSSAEHRSTGLSRPWKCGDKFGQTGGFPGQFGHSAAAARVCSSSARRKRWRYCWGVTPRRRMKARLAASARAGKCCARSVSALRFSKTWACAACACCLRRNRCTASRRSVWKSTVMLAKGHERGESHSG